MKNQKQYNASQRSLLYRMVKQLCPPVMWEQGRRWFGMTKTTQMVVPVENLDENAELRRLASIPRYVHANVVLRGCSYTMSDAPSFAHMFRTYFVEESYRFASLSDNPYIVDCGANVGVGVRYWKTLFPSARVVALEPDPQIFDLLVANTSGLSDVELLRKAAWSADTVLSFAAVGADGGHLSSLADHGDEVVTLEVEAVRLREYLVGNVDLLKIDIEGAELEVLRDCQDRLGLVQNLFVEYHSFVGSDQELSALFGIIEAAGFRTYSSVESPAKQPFVCRPVFNCKDFRLNIWCFRN